MLKASEEYWKRIGAISKAVEKERLDPKKASMAKAELLTETWTKDLLLAIGSVHQPRTVCIHLVEIPNRPGVVSIRRRPKSLPRISDNAIDGGGMLNTEILRSLQGRARISYHQMSVWLP